VTRRPADIAQYLDSDQQKLYGLIWKRTLASQMESAVLDQVAIDLASADGQVRLRATGSVIAFDGFIKVYREDSDDPGQDEGENVLLPDLKVGAALERLKVEAEQHFTQPPPRYTEASLVKRLEELGIGRPSTYASIITVLQQRDYVRLDNKRFVPEDRGRLVTAFLTSFFERYVAYNFTAEMEGKLDDISGGRIDWKMVLRDFWRDFSAAVDETKGLGIKDVLEALNQRLGPHFFRSTDGSDPRACPACAEGRLSLKVGRFGAFIGCSNYPECRYTRPLVPLGTDEKDAVKPGEAGPRVLGSDPASALEVTLRKGPYGYYVQLGEETGEGKRKTKPKRASLIAGMSPDHVDLEQALKLLALPRDVGVHPETGETVVAGVGRYGPYVNMGDTYVSLKDDDVLGIGLNRAVALLGEARKRKGPSRVLGSDPVDGKPVMLKEGRYGTYVQHGTTRATLPKHVGADTLELDQALELLAAKANRSDEKGKKKNGGRKAEGKTAAASASGKAPKTAARKTTRPKAADSKAARSKATRSKAAKSPTTKATATRTKTAKVQADTDEAAES
jgi:DNA topoisomerase-1